MCFSAEASFGAGIVLSVAGVVAVSRTNHKSQLLFAAIPLLFAVQQFSEGFLWLALRNPDHESWRLPSAYFFLAFAQVVWPTWVSLAVYRIEKDPLRKKWIGVTLVVGILVSSYLTFCLFNFPISIELMAYHIKYEIGSPHFKYTYLSGVFYFIPTVITLFIPSIYKMRLLGVLIFASYLTTWMLFSENIISVWCFFAAIISAYIVSIVSDLRKR